MEDTDQKKDQKMDDTEKMENIDSEQQEDIMLSRWEILSRGRFCIEQTEDSENQKDVMMS